MNEIIPFRFEDTSVRVLDIDGEPWFVLADVTSVLEHSNSRMVAQRLDDDVRTTYPIQDSMGREQMTYIISEPGLYEVIATSRSVSAKPFKKWVFGEVLPQLRKTGSYGQVQQLTGPELMAAALIEADSVIKSQTLQIEAADKYISELTPKAEYVDLYVTDQDLRTLREVAKNLGAQETEVRTALLERRWIYCETASRWSEKEGRKVTQRRYSPMADKRDYFRTIPRHEAPRFKDGIDHTLKVTPAGARAIGMALVRWGIIPSPLTDVAMEVA